MRHPSRREPSGSCDRLHPQSSPAAVAIRTRPPAGSGCLASLHHSGYVRQAAVLRLAEKSDGFEVPYLLLRVNDWVSPVREAARAALWERLRPEHARHLVRNLSLVTRLTRCGRDDHSPFVAAVFDLLRGPDSRSALLEGLSSSDREVRRACFDLAIETTDIPLLDLLERLLQHDDPILRLRAVQVARARLEPQDYLNPVEVMRADRFMPVRRETLLGLIERCPDMAEDASMSSLLDPHISVREVAHHSLRKVGGFDLAEFYRSGIRSFADDPARLAVTIAGLGETGVQKDADLVLLFLTHPATKVRRSTVRALGRLDGDWRVGEFLSALGDDRASVSRQAREVLRVRLSLVAGWRLWEMFERDQRPHVRRNTLSLIANLGKWARLPFLIDACTDGDPEIAARALHSVQDWITQFNRSFARPSPEDIRLALEALEKSRSVLSPNILVLLEFHLKGW